MTGPQLAPEERASLRPWWIAILVLILVFGALLAVDFRDMTTCKGDALKEVDVPAAWASFTPLPDLGGYEIESKEGMCVGHGIQCGMLETELRDSKVCPREGVSLDGYFNGNIYQSSSDIRVYEKGGTFVATAYSKTMPTGPEKPVVAFVRAPHGIRLVFRHAHAKSLAEAFIFVLLVLGAGGILSMRHQRRQEHGTAGLFARGTTVLGGIAVLWTCFDAISQFLSTVRIS